MRKWSSGFTLVELALVIVLIGLLIGGILVAMSMTATAKIEKVVHQAGQFDVGVADFQQKYQFLPGDALSFGFQDGSGNHGDGDGMIEDATSGSGLGEAWSGEESNFWAEMSTTGDIRNSAAYTPIVNGNLAVDGPTPNMPSVGLGIKGTGIFATNDTGEIFSSFNISGVYIIGKVTDSPGTALTFASGNIGDALAPADLLALDQKMDDGNPQTGNMIAFSNAGTCFNGSGGSASYNVSISDPVCSVAFKYLGNYGQGSSGGSGGGGGGGGSCPLVCANGSSPDVNDSTCSACSTNCNYCQNGGTPDQTCSSCSGCAGGYTGADCSIAPCMSSCPGGITQNAAPDCSCIDPGCQASGGIWDSGAGTCDCSAWTGDGVFNGTACICETACNFGTPDDHYEDCGCADPGCVASGGSWERDNGECTCPADGYPDGGSWTGTSCLCPGMGCQNGGSQAPSPDCSCTCIGHWGGGDCSSCNLDCGGIGTVNDSSVCDYCNCRNGNGGINCEINCDGGWSGITCNICNVSCQNGGSPDPDCNYCNCVGGWSGADCSIAPTCATGCNFGLQNPAPDCSCNAPPGCATSFGSWNSITGDCTCGAGGDGSFDGSNCIDGNGTCDNFNTNPGC